MTGSGSMALTEQDRASSTCLSIAHITQKPWSAPGAGRKEAAPQSSKTRTAMKAFKKKRLPKILR